MHTISLFSAVWTLRESPLPGFSLSWYLLRICLLKRKEKKKHLLFPLKRPKGRRRCIITSPKTPMTPAWLYFDPRPRSCASFCIRGEHFSIELTYNYGVESYKIGDGFNGMGLRLPDLEGIAERAKAAGGEIVSGPEVRLSCFFVLVLVLVLIPILILFLFLFSSSALSADSHVWSSRVVRRSFPLSVCPPASFCFPYCTPTNAPRPTLLEASVVALHRSCFLAAIYGRSKEGPTSFLSFSSCLPSYLQPASMTLLCFVAFSNSEEGLRLAVVSATVDRRPILCSIDGSNRLAPGSLSFVPIWFTNPLLRDTPVQC